MQKTTGTLTEILTKTEPGQAGQFLQEYEDELFTDKRPFAAYMRSLFKKKGLCRQDVFLAADISEGYGYKLISEEKHTRQRDVILRLCLGAQMTLSEVQRALRLYGMAPLYPRIKRDAVLIIAINTGIIETEKVDQMLEGYGMEPLHFCNTAE